MQKKGDFILKNLRTLREERGLSQQKLADKFCLSQQSIYKYENGLAEPDFATLKQFASFFNTSIDYLIGYETADGTQETLLLHWCLKLLKKHIILNYIKNLVRRHKLNLTIFLKQL